MPVTTRGTRLPGCSFLGSQLGIVKFAEDRYIWIEFLTVLPFLWNPNDFVGEAISFFLSGYNTNPRMTASSTPARVKKRPHLLAHGGKSVHINFPLFQFNCLLSAELSVSGHDAREKQQRENWPLDNLADNRQRLAFWCAFFGQCLLGHERPPLLINFALAQT